MQNEDTFRSYLSKLSQPLLLSPRIATNSIGTCSYDRIIYNSGFEEFWTPSTVTVENHSKVVSKYYSIKGQTNPQNFIDFLENLPKSSQYSYIEGEDYLYNDDVANLQYPNTLYPLLPFIVDNQPQLSDHNLISLKMEIP